MISSWIRANLLAFQSAGRRLYSQALASALSIAVIGIAIMLPLGLYLAVHNVKAATGRLDTEPKVNVYLQVNAGDADARAVGALLNAMPNAGSVKFVSREAALAEMKQLAGVADLLTGLESNPLPHAFSVQPKSTDATTMAAMRTEISLFPKVETVALDFEWARKLQRFAGFVERLVSLLAIILGLAVIFITGNTIRLQMLTHKDEIEVSRLIGATDRFIQRPFLYYGSAQGLLAGLLAILGLATLSWWANGEVHALTNSYHYDFKIEFLTLWQGLATIAGASALGWVGAIVSVKHFLRQISS